MMRSKRSIALALVVLLSGCHTFEIGLVQTPTPTLRVTVTLTPTAASTSVVAPIYTAIALPTSMATLTPTATAKPIVIKPTQLPVRTLTPTAVSADVPTIVSFSVEPREVNPGDIVTLRWSATKVDFVDIYQHVPDTLPSYNTVNLSATGQITQAIRAQQRLWQSFELSASNVNGAVSQTITVSIRCPYTYFFSPLPVEDRTDWSCPDDDPIASTAAEQVFENGRMMWLQHDDRIYVFFNDGTYQTFEDTWVAGQADTVPGLTPPQGRYAPVRGFGKVWSGDEDVRARLGWALAAEQGFETQMQGGWLHCCSRLNAVNRPIYLRNVEGRIMRLWPGEFPLGQWKWSE